MLIRHSLRSQFNIKGIDFLFDVFWIDFCGVWQRWVEW